MDHDFIVFGVWCIVYGVGCTVYGVWGINLLPVHSHVQTISISFKIGREFVLHIIDSGILFF